MKNRNENLWKHQKRLEKNLTVPKVRKGFFSLVRICWLRLQWRKWYREPFALRYVPAGWSGSSVKSVHSAYILLADEKKTTTFNREDYPLGVSFNKLYDRWKQTVSSNSSPQNVSPGHEVSVAIKRESLTTFFWKKVSFMSRSIIWSAGSKTLLYC